MARQYKLARKMKGIALTAAAKELGVTQPTLSGWESERKTPSIEGLIRMAKFYGVTTDFLLGLTADNDPRPDWLRPIAPDILPVLHETPVYVLEKGWAFVDAVEKQLRFADGSLLPVADVKNVFLLPPAYTLTNPPDRPPLGKMRLSRWMRSGWNRFLRIPILGSSCGAGIRLEHTMWRIKLDSGSIWTSMVPNGWHFQKKRAISQQKTFGDEKCRCTLDFCLQNQYTKCVSISIANEQ